MARLLTKDGVEFAVIDNVTRQLFFVLMEACVRFHLDHVVITSGSDGVHSGPDDPHYIGHALDVRTHDLPPDVSRAAFVQFVQGALGPDYYAFLESPNTSNEHLHVQLAKGHAMPTAFPEPDTPRAV